MPLGVDDIGLFPLLPPLRLPLEVALEVHEALAHSAVQGQPVIAVKGEIAVECERIVVVGIGEVATPQQMQLAGVDSVEHTTLPVVGDEVHTVAHTAAGEVSRQRDTVAHVAHSQ